ncbi:hypothetical protein EYF80_004688 [Liparis tanakae]|uniref:Uncharacterized protein n=1 Tax=Liparis tanakae TaxID=230148 RepID=A0A4Z2J569_9TELE|nr:hypothetical protein EYF80_004688 [Liparis tanakae]
MLREGRGAGFTVKSTCYTCLATFILKVVEALHPTVHLLGPQNTFRLHHAHKRQKHRGKWRLAHGKQNAHESNGSHHLTLRTSQKPPSCRFLAGWNRKMFCAAVLTGVPKLLFCSKERGRSHEGGGARREEEAREQTDLLPLLDYTNLTCSSYQAAFNPLITVLLIFPGSSSTHRQIFVSADLVEAAITSKIVFALPLTPSFFFSQSCVLSVPRSACRSLPRFFRVDLPDNN